MNKKGEGEALSISGTFPVPDRLGLIATDLDGTLIPHGGTVSQRTIDSLAAAAAEGIHVVFVTGRPPRWLRPVIDVTGHDGYAIGANGTVLLDLAAGTTDVIQALAPTTVVRLAEVLRAAVPDVVFGVETVDDIRVESGFLAARRERPAEGLAPRRPVSAPQADDVADLLDEDPIIKMIAVSPGSTPDQLLSVGSKVVGDLATTTHSSVGTAMIELSPPGVTKASTLASLAARLEVAADRVISFGDMPNDLSMLRWSGLGYAMSGGHPEALAAADHLAPPALEDGVAQVLETYLADLRLTTGSRGTSRPG